MPIFKYVVVNQEKKKLSGTVEAPDEITARNELNNLGFSILLLEKTENIPATASRSPKFIFEAVDKNSKIISGTIPADTEEQALYALKHEYALTVTAIWKENSTEEEIKSARKKGSEKLKEELNTDIPVKQNLSPEQEKEEQILKTKIELILKEVNELLPRFEAEIPADQKNEIYKKIDKLLRIKNSTNLDYIFATAEELLHFIQSQEKTLKEKGLKDKQVELIMDTRIMLDQLNRTNKPKTLTEDVLERIQHWETIHKTEKNENFFTRFVRKILTKVKNILTTPPEILALKEQIRIYNKQIIEFIKLYFKEKAPDYKAKVKNTIKTIWDTRKKTKEKLKLVKKQLKEKNSESSTIPTTRNLALSFLEELNSLSGWLLTFYLAYYFLALYITSKDFGFAKIPSGFFIYQSHIFKYVLVILFLFHATTSLKINFFKKNIFADILLPIFFIFGTILTLLNY